MALVRVSFHPSRVVADVPRGTTIAEAARVAGLRVDTPCSSGSCGRDLVQVRIGARLENVLACAATVEEDTEVSLPSGEHETVQTVVAFHGDAAPARRVDGSELGVALDVGTTTLAAALVDVSSGRVVARRSTLNPLVTYGHDVISRIRHATAHRHGLRVMHRDLVAAVNLLVDLLAAESGAARPTRLVAAGNTTMQHILLGRPVSGLGEFPYVADTLDVVRVEGASLGLHVEGEFATFPCMSAYVGGDIVAGLLAVGDAPTPWLFVDVGTNGEIVLATDDGLLASSTAAGPCFEGMTISCGMRAAAGAVQHVVLDDDGAMLDVVGGGAPRGICGSGLLDLVSELRRVGLVDGRGRLSPPGADPRISETDGKRAFRLADGVTLTQQDVRQVQLAKAAVRAGIETLLSEASIEASDLRRVNVAGAFGFHLSESSLFGTGMLPPDAHGALAFVGNSSLEGAVRAVADPVTLARAAVLARGARSVDLSQIASFESAFFREMAL
jgi:uncharacterized 2Fe-2S/4Fe-4S cluster protein (DUF4445 family)